MVPFSEGPTLMSATRDETFIPGDVHARITTDHGPPLQKHAHRRLSSGKPSELFLNEYATYLDHCMGDLAKRS